MPHKPPDSPLGAFLAALREEKIPCILIGAMAAIEQGSPLTTIGADLSVWRQKIDLGASLLCQPPCLRA